MIPDLTQSWAAPANPKPIVIVGAGGIIRDAHMPAYKMAGTHPEETDMTFYLYMGTSARDYLETDWARCVSC